jgi:putative two-component system protein, hydrogenase maturation factor HypX/HoxX
MMALAADHVFARSGVVLNPHYKKIGNLYGSEYWTYTLPARVGAEQAVELTEACQPIGAVAAREIGLVDEAFGGDADDFEGLLEARVQHLANDPHLASLLDAKRRRRRADEVGKPLAAYRAAN